MSLIFIILKYVVDTFFKEKLQLKFCNLNFISLQYSKTHMNFVGLMKTIENWDKKLKET